MRGTTTSCMASRRATTHSTCMRYQETVSYRTRCVARTEIELNPIWKIFFFCCKSARKNNIMRMRFFPYVSIIEPMYCTSDSAVSKSLSVRGRGTVPLYVLRPNRSRFNVLSVFSCTLFKPFARLLRRNGHFRLSL